MEFEAFENYIRLKEVNVNVGILTLLAAYYNRFAISSD